MLPRENQLPERDDAPGLYHSDGGIVFKFANKLSKKKPLFICSFLSCFTELPNYPMFVLF